MSDWASGMGGGESPCEEGPTGPQLIKNCQLQMVRIKKGMLPFTKVATSACSRGQDVTFMADAVDGIMVCARARLCVRMCV